MQSNRNWLVVALISLFSFTLPTSGMLAQQSAPQELRWDAKLRPRVDAALAITNTDPVNGVYALEDLIGSNEKPRPNDRQKAWLRQTIAEARLLALSRLQSEFDAAASTADLRTMVIVEAVGRALSTDGIGRSVPLETARAQALRETQPSPVWRVDDVKGTLLAGPYVEETPGVDRYTLTPKSGFKVLEVQATVTNLSESEDSRRSAWFLGPIKMMAVGLTGMLRTEEAPAVPIRYMDQSLVFLASGAGTIVDCSYQARAPSQGQGGLSMQFRGGGGVKVSVPQKVKRGETGDFRFVFAVPATGAMVYRLWILGATPVDVTINQ